MASKDYPHLKRAPIVEAVFDVGVEAREGVTLDSLREFGKTLFPDYLEPSPLLHFHASLGPGAAASTSTEVGQIYWAGDRKRAVQARVDGLSVSMVESYSTWEDLRQEARTRWEAYVAAVQPVRVTRPALRFINRIELSPGQRLDECVSSLPVLAASLPQEWTSHVMRLVVPAGPSQVAAVTQALEEPGPNNKRALILDIDVHSTRELDVADVEGLWAEFEALRNCKNRFFFGSLTKKQVEGFQ